MTHGNFTVHIDLGGLHMRVSGVFTIHVAGSGGGGGNALTLTPANGALPDEAVGNQASGEIAISGGTPPYALTPVTGLPPGVSAALSADGTKVEITGAPTTAGDASFNVEVTDSGA
jgi:hypothetical protein